MGLSDCCLSLKKGELIGDKHHSDRRCQVGAQAMRDRPSPGTAASQRGINCPVGYNAIMI